MMPVCAWLRRGRRLKVTLRRSLRATLRRCRHGPGDAGGVLADEPEMGALVQGGAVGFEVVAGRQSGAGLFEKGSILRQGEGLDGSQGVEERGAETIRGFELGGPGCAVFLVFGLSGEEGGSGRGQAVAVVFEQGGHDAAANATEVEGVREEL